MNQYFQVFGTAVWMVALTPVMAQNVAALQPTTTASAASHETNRIGTFKEVKTPAWVSPSAGPSDKRKDAASGEPLMVGERLVTGRNGAASLTLKDGTVLSLGPDTSLDLSQFQFNTTTQEGSFGLNLLQGSLRVITGMLAKVNPDRFRITTPTAVVGVRGTDFIVEADPPVVFGERLKKRPLHRKHPTR